ncbi:MAG TPA: TIGR02679 family protein [Firmicutes bacterium]|nr:TIGR02679 family protein [Bacillota bacterium]
MMSVDERLADAVEFFRKEKGLHRLIDQVIQKYRRTGDIRGKVKLDRLDDAERAALSELFRADYSSRDSVAIPARCLAEALERTRFAGLELARILEGYQGGPIRTLAEERDERQAAKSAYFESLRDTCGSPHGRAWLDNAAVKGPGSRSVHRSYGRDPAALRAQLETVLRALADLPTDPSRPDSGRYERLPVFASRIAGDPHGFDIHTELGKHLIAALNWVRASESPTAAPIASPLGAEDITELLAQFGIIRDDLLNFVTCTGILASGAAPCAPPGTARSLATWVAACQEGAVLNVPLRELVRVQSCRPFETCAGPWEHRDAGPAVFVIENSGVFSAVLDEIADDLPRCVRRPPMVCTHGQFKLAAWIILGKLAAGGATLFYSGDFDPEGLQMAQKLMDRFPESVQPWRYGLQDYLHCMPETPLPADRLAKLQTITAPLLLPAKEAMLAEQKAGYQERLIDALATDIREALSQG